MDPTMAMMLLFAFGLLVGVAVALPMWASETHTVIVSAERVNWEHACYLARPDRDVR
jgi:hypothetical protein